MLRHAKPTPFLHFNARNDTRLKNNSYLSPLVNLLSLENAKKNRLFLCILLAYS